MLSVISAQKEKNYVFNTPKKRKSGWSKRLAALKMQWKWNCRLTRGRVDTFASSCALQRSNVYTIKMRTSYSILFLRWTGPNKWTISIGPSIFIPFCATYASLYYIFADFLNCATNFIKSNLRQFSLPSLRKKRVIINHIPKSNQLFF